MCFNVLIQVSPQLMNRQKSFSLEGGGGRGVGEVGGFPENCMKTEATEQQFVFMG